MEDRDVYGRHVCAEERLWAREFAVFFVICLCLIIGIKTYISVRTMNRDTQKEVTVDAGDVSYSGASISGFLDELFGIE